MTTEVIDSSRIAGTQSEVLCGHCRGVVRPAGAILCDGQEMECQHCHRLLWFEIADGGITQHQGTRPAGRHHLRIAAP